jgi:hypothetical protein
MNKKAVLGSPFEMSLRILLMLNEIKNIECDLQIICAIDFIAVYAADFNLLDENLHGYGNYRFSEYPARKNLVTSALKILVLNGTIAFFANKNGFTYKITTTGRKVCYDLTDSYSNEYRIAVRAVCKRYDISNDSAMLNDINKHTICSLQEDKNE